VLAINNAISDVTNGPGPNNEVVNLLKNAGIEIKGVTWATPLGGRDALLPKAGRDFDKGKNEFAKWAGDRTGIHLGGLLGL
jgi:hypothetical protein